MSQSRCDLPPPCPISAPGAPWKLHPQVARQIRCTAARMVGTAGLTSQDREDLEQELTADLLERVSHFDASRATRRTFIARLLENAAASIIAAREAGIRDWRREVCSLNEPREDDEGDYMELLDLLDEEIGLNKSVQAAELQREQLALRIDLERAVLALPEDLRQVCRLLEKTDSRRSAQWLKISRAAHFSRVLKLRKALKEAGLKKYL